MISLNVGITTFDSGSQEAKVKIVNTISDRHLTNRFIIELYLIEILCVPCVVTTIYKPDVKFAGVAFT